MSKNKTLSDAKSAKNDEFYTQYADIQKEAACATGCSARPHHHPSAQSVKSAESVDEENRGEENGRQDI